MTRTPSKRRWYPRLLASLTALAALAGTVQAQENLDVVPQPAAVAPRLTLDESLSLAYEKQPALAAARASLAAAQSGQQGLNNLPIYARLAARDLPVRKEQACLGVTIASAGVQQAEFETRYAVTRNYYSVLYVRMQQELVEDVLGRLEKGLKTAKRVLDSGEVSKITKIDIDIFGANIDLLRVKQIEAEIGGRRALAALREAIGVGPEFPLDVNGGTLPAPLPSLNKDELIALALANRSEIVQANSASGLTSLEIEAQSRKRFSLQVPTFGMGADIHAKPIPQGVFNNEYRPGAIGIEMPNMLIGKRYDRMARASNLNDRASAVVDKTNNLVALEAENYYLKWLDAKDKLDLLAAVRPKVDDVARTIDKRLQDGNASGAEYIQATTLVDTIRAQYNDALYNHALALTALERVTAGGFRICTAVTQQP